MKKLLALIAVAAACGATPALPQIRHDRAASGVPTAEADMRSAATSNRAFGIALFKRLAEKPGNVFISPMSLAGAFGPVAAGARGETRDAIGKVLGFPADDASLHPQLGGLLRTLESDGEGARVSIANALWLMQGFAVKPQFVAVSRDSYDAEVDSLDFNNSPEAAGRINRWVSGETKGRIPKLFADDAFDEMTRVVVTNAVHFLGDWMEPFNAAYTRRDLFHLQDGSTRQVPMMTGERVHPYVEAGAVQLLEMPYKGDRLSMVVILPKARDGLPAIEGQLSAAKLDSWLRELDSARAQYVFVQLPKVEIESGYELVEPLKRMGMSVAFDDQRANFSGIADMPPRLFISDVVQKTYVRIDEKGTEAAAATGVVVSAERSGPELTFRADHPFLVLIRDKPTGAILFMGRIADPSAS